MRPTINKRLAYPWIRIIYVYQWTLSPDKSPLFSPLLRGRICHHTPHCSAYGLQCLKRYGLFPGIIYMIDRITSCTGGTTTISHDPAQYRVVFASSAPIGVPFLQKIAADNRYDLVGVMTNPDQPVGRGMKVRANIIKSTAIDLGIDEENIQTPASLRITSKKYADQAQNTTQRLTALKPDILVVIAYGKILPQHILDIPKVAPINVHGSLLPAYRGASPIQSVLLDDQTETGITIMRMEAGLDTGPMISKKSFPLTIHTTALDIIHQFQEFGPQQLVDTIRDYGKGHADHTEQDDAQATHCGKLTKEDGIIQPWIDSLHHANNIYRGCYLRPKAHFVLDQSRGSHQDKTIIIESLTLDETLREDNKDQPLISTDNTPNPAIISLTVKPQGKKAIQWDDFVRGYREKDQTPDHIFIRNKKARNPSLPYQVFRQTNHTTLIHQGGHLFQTTQEYEVFIQRLQSRKEKYFYIHENQDAKIKKTRKTNDIFIKININTTKKEFDEIIKSRKPNFGLYIDDRYIYGEEQDRGIYLGEFPTLMIIKCTSQLKADFQKIFNIVNDGYNQVSDIINSEFKESPELLKIFMNNYHL